MRYELQDTEKVKNLFDEWQEPLMDSYLQKVMETGCEKPIDSGKNWTISYIQATDRPLSSDVGIIREGKTTWLYDVGNQEAAGVLAKIASICEEPDCRIVLSHFHQDHIGSLEKLSVNKNTLYVSRETSRHVPDAIIVDGELYFDHFHIFPLPSSHAKGCLGFEVDETYAFVGDALYCKRKGNRATYNAQLLKEEIAVLKKLQAPYLLVSHWEGMVRKREDVLKELETIYRQREKGNPEIVIGSEDA